MKLAVIPARGGSKRIPRKNIRRFCGQPILAYSIATARQTRLFDHIVVSTDDPEIASIAREHGAETPFIRPTELADDFTGTNAIARHAVEWFEAAGSSVDYVCCIYATAPLLEASSIIAGFEKLCTQACEFTFGITRYDFPVQRALQQDENGCLHAMYPQHINARSQDLEEAWHDAGQFYWGTARAFVEQRPMMNGTAAGIPLPRYRVQDIDTEEDWQQAELLYRMLQQTP